MAVPGPIPEILGRLAEVAGPRLQVATATNMHVDQARSVRILPGTGNGADVAVSFASSDTALAALVESLLELVADKQQLETDMESMYGSSLSLLEEVSMMGDILPKLPTGETEEEIAQMGLAALMVAASAQRGFYLRRHRQLDGLEIVVHAVMDHDHRQPMTLGIESASLIMRPAAAAGDSLLWRAIDGHGGPILEAATAWSDTLDVNSPLRLAQRQVVAVPVRYGSGDRAVTLGLILLMDKRANSYSTSHEMGSQETKLAASVASMLGSVLGTRQVVALQKEMNLGQDLQRQILPATAPQLAGFDLAGACRTHGAIGGDYFDFLPLADDRLLAVIADVSGHNLPSGMVMVSARACLHLLARMHACPGAVFDDLARSMYADLQKTERFITAAAVALRADSGQIEIVSAGHNPTMIWRAADQRVDRYNADDTILGFLPAPHHAVQDTRLDQGDVLVLYTDGVTEASRGDGEMFGEERLADVISAAATSDAKALLEAVLGAVAEWTDSRDGDDVSVVVIKATSRAQR